MSPKQLPFIINHTPDTVLSPLHALPYLSHCYHSHFTNESSKAQRALNDFPAVTQLANGRAVTVGKSLILGPESYRLPHLLERTDHRGVGSVLRMRLDDVFTAQHALLP